MSIVTAASTHEDEERTAGCVAPCPCPWTSLRPVALRITRQQAIWFHGDRPRLRPPRRQRVCLHDPHHSLTVCVLRLWKGLWSQPPPRRGREDPRQAKEFDHALGRFRTSGHPVFYAIDLERHLLVAVRVRNGVVRPEDLMVLAVSLRPARGRHDAVEGRVPLAEALQPDAQ